MRKILYGIMAAVLTALMVWALIIGARREVARYHMHQVCEPGFNTRAAGLFSGVHTHRVKGLGKSDSRAVKIKTCEALGFNPTNR
jgi:hypothetical protein